MNDERGRPIAARPELKSALDLIRRHVDSAHAAVALFLGGCFTVLVGGTWAFVEFAVEVLEGESRRFDEAVMGWINSHASERLDELALEIT